MMAKVSLDQMEEEEAKPILGQVNRVEHEDGNGAKA